MTTMPSTATAVSIGCGSAYAGDLLEPGEALAASGLVDYMAFDCLAERTLALAQIRRLADPSKGQDERLDELLTRFGPFLSAGKRIVGNFGAANPEAAGRELVDGLRSRGISATVGVIYGDDVRGAVLRDDVELPEMGVRISEVADRVVSANAYIGADPIVELLDAGATLVLGGRIADPSLFVAPICHDLGWSMDDWDRVALATLAGHLLECGVHGTGGNFEDPPFRKVKDPHNLGQPMATVSGDSVLVTKLPGTGGAVDARTARTQLLYEVHDPRAYLTPDVIADFSEVEIEDLGDDVVRLSRARGHGRPDTLKVLVGLDLGWKVTGEISYGGPGCVTRAQRAEEVLRARCAPVAAEVDELRIDLIGQTSLFGGEPDPHAGEVRLRIAARVRDRAAGEFIVGQANYLYFGPAGGGGVVTTLVPAIAVTPAYIPRAEVPLEVEVMSS
jgi:hypothetical protein